jgi:hypothetical protein
MLERTPIISSFSLSPLLQLLTNFNFKPLPTINTPVSHSSLCLSIIPHYEDFYSYISLTFTVKFLGVFKVDKIFIV